jgi:2Fe-2S ferredoxin
MVKITFIEPSGIEKVLDVPEGWSLMQAATANGVEGIEAECGGSCACATCHVYLEGAPAANAPPPEEHELGMLELTAAERKPNSRLSCQIKAAPAIEGLVVRIAETQSL